MTKIETLLKKLRISKRFYCLSCNTIYHIWGAKHKINYFCQDCPMELLPDKPK